MEMSCTCNNDRANGPYECPCCAGHSREEVLCHNCRAAMVESDVFKTPLCEKCSRIIKNISNIIEHHIDGFIKDRLDNALGKEEDVIKGLGTDDKLKLYLENKEHVFLHYNNETGSLLWAVCVVNDPTFWLDAFEDENEAIEFCKNHDLKVVNRREVYGTE